MDKLIKALLILATTFLVLVSIITFVMTFAREYNLNLNKEQARLNEGCHETYQQARYYVIWELQQIIKAQEKALKDE